MVQSVWKTLWQFLAKLNIFKPFNPAITFLGIYANELKNLCPIAVLFITAKTWEQSKWPSVGEWINKLVHTDSEILSRTENKWATKPWATMKRHGGNLNAYFEVKLASLKGHILYHSNYRTLRKSKTMGTMEKINISQQEGN